MGAALQKIAAHISNPKKFAKASALLRQLFSEGKLSGAHGELAFEVSSPLCYIPHCCSVRDRPLTLHACGCSA